VVYGLDACIREALTGDEVPLRKQVRIIESGEYTYNDELSASASSAMLGFESLLNRSRTVMAPRIARDQANQFVVTAVANIAAIKGVQDVA